MFQVFILYQNNFTYFGNFVITILSLDFLKNFPKWIKEDLFLVVFNVFKFR